MDDFAANHLDKGRVGRGRNLFGSLSRAEQRWQRAREQRVLSLLDGLGVHRFSPQSSRTGTASALDHALRDPSNGGFNVGQRQGKRRLARTVRPRKDQYLPAHAALEPSRVRRELEDRLLSVALTCASEKSVLTLRCTQRLLTRLKAPRSQVAVAEPTTLLGDWYANLLHIGKAQLVLAVSERTFLPVVLPAAPVSSIVTRFRSDVAHVLRALNVDPSSINQELAEMGTVVIGRTASRQVTGVLVDFAKGLDLYLEHEPSLLACSLKLAETPCSPLYKTTVTPNRATPALFAHASASRNEAP